MTEKVMVKVGKEKGESRVDNDIGDDGAIKICEALKTNTTLRSLNMRCSDDKIIKLTTNK